LTETGDIMFADDVWNRSEEIAAELRELGSLHQMRLANGMPVTLTVRHRGRSGSTMFGGGQARS
jgi:hypothetical protein